ncbi:MAG: hypothetical protein RBR15_11655 [Sphaerochaeta sp.]|nr:hypothetical protein [Sphaerochaeta sp.]
MEDLDYLEKLQNPKYWFQYAINQKYIGDQILDNCMMKKEVLQNINDVNSKFITLWENAHYHYGIGIENGLKGIVIKYSPDKINFKIEEKQIVLKNIGGKPGKTHDLLSLAESVNLFSDRYHLFKYEQDIKSLKIVLSHLSDMIKWGARYPIPNGSKKYFVFDDSIPSVLVYGFHILDVIEPIFQLFSTELKQTTN